MSGLVSPLTNLSKAAEPADVSTNTSDIAALTTALAAKASQTALDATNTLVHTKGDATTVSNNVALISALQSGKADQASLTSTDAIVGAHTTSLNALGGRMTTAEGDINTVTTAAAGVGIWSRGSNYYAFHHPDMDQSASADNYRQAWRNNEVHTGS